MKSSPKSCANNTVQYYVHKNLEITYDLSSLPMSRASERWSPEIFHFLSFPFLKFSCILKIKKCQTYL